MEQTISDVENLTKTVNFNEGGGSDVEAGIQFIYHMREHLVDIGIATVYGLVVHCLLMYGLGQRLRDSDFIEYAFLGKNDGLRHTRIRELNNCRH